MKLRKAKRFNTIESYASCVCMYSTCSCSCNCSCTGGKVYQADEVGTLNRTGQIAYDEAHHNAHAVYLRN